MQKSALSSSQACNLSFLLVICLWYLRPLRVIYQPSVLDLVPSDQQASKYTVSLPRSHVFRQDLPKSQYGCTFISFLSFLWEEHAFTVSPHSASLCQLGGRYL